MSKASLKAPSTYKGYLTYAGLLPYISAVRELMTRYKGLCYVVAKAFELVFGKPVKPDMIKKLAIQQKFPTQPRKGSPFIKPHAVSTLRSWLKYCEVDLPKTARAVDGPTPIPEKAVVQSKEVQRTSYGFEGHLRTPFGTFWVAFESVPHETNPRPLKTKTQAEVRATYEAIQEDPQVAAVKKNFEKFLAGHVGDAVNK